MALTKQQKRRLCHGCRDDFYNGHNPLGIKECWGLKSAKQVERVCVGIWDRPPYLWHPEKTLSCHRPNGMVWLQRGDVRVMDKKRYDEVTASEDSRREWERAK